jgi:hypothetical protein
MTGIEAAYLVGVIVAFVAFSAMLAYCSHTSSGTDQGGK